MEQAEFQKIKDKFIDSTTQEKIDIYVGAEGLDQSQYKELLKMFPLEELDKLEAALM